MTIVNDSRAGWRIALRSFARARLRRIRMAMWRARTSKQGQFIDRTAHFVGARNVQIGVGSVIGEHCWINVNHRSGDEPRITIGNQSLVGRRNTLSSGTEIVLGDFFLSGPDCIFNCADHVIDDPTIPYAATGATGKDSIIIEPNCWFGAKCVVLGNIRIGRGSVIGAGTLVIRDIPPFSLAVGNPARVLKRYSFIRQEWVAVADLTDEDIAAMPSDEVYGAMLCKNAGMWAPPRSAAGFAIGSAV